MIRQDVTWARIQKLLSVLLISTKEHIPRDRSRPGEDSNAAFRRFPHLEHEKRENRNKTQPGHIGKPPADSGNQLLCDIRFSGHQRLSNRSIDRIPCFRGKCGALVALRPGLPAILKLERCRSEPLVPAHPAGIREQGEGGQACRPAIRRSIDRRRRSPPVAEERCADLQCDGSANNLHNRSDQIGKEERERAGTGLLSGGTRSTARQPPRPEQAGPIASAHYEIG